MKQILLFTLLKFSICDFYDNRKPWISTYVAETGVTADTRPNQDYIQVYNPVSRIYTYATKDYFAGQYQPPPIITGTLKVNPLNGNVERARLNRKQRSNKKSVIKHSDTKIDKHVI